MAAKERTSMAKFRLPFLGTLRAFEAAARHQSIRKACNELHVNHASISRHIQNLEHQIGQKLFRRTHRKVVLTDAGESMYRAVEVGFTHIERAFNSLTGKGYVERLVISADPDFAALWLVPRLGDFYARAPGALVEIVAEETSVSLEDPRVSCAIQYTKAGLKVSRGEILFRSRLFPVCAASLMKTRPIKSPEDLSGHMLLHDRSISEWMEYLDKAKVTEAIDAKAGPVFNETSLCLEAALRGQGVAIGDDFLAAMFLSEGRLVRPLDMELLSRNAYYFIAPDSGARHPMLEVFRAWLFETVCQRGSGT
jgi:LysR family transcriptional regulator, glycine cleavage system transcriptional activator